MNFFELGYQSGKLACTFQPAPLSTPPELNQANQAEVEFFWAGYQVGWDDAEATASPESSSVIFFKDQYHG